MTPASPAADSKPRRPWYRRPTGVITAIIVAGSFGLWTYAFSGAARKDPPDTLRDPAYAAQAEALCAPTRAFVLGLEPAAAATDPIDRAATLRQANAAIAELRRELATLRPTNDFDRNIVDQWLVDWDQYLTDRAAYTEILATGEDALFKLTARNEQDYTKSMDNFATVNDMPSCKTPGDV
ncbi:MAG: hypothetical protein IT196_10825 [Acidimicrobiales bacterium]|nr:hypothetical protein [Acidimicrobiales bacterium]